MSLNVSLIVSQLYLSQISSPTLNQVTFNYIKTLVAEEEAVAVATQQGQQNPSQRENRQPKEEKSEPDSSSAASASGATVDADRHDLCDEVCEDDLQQYRDARLEEMLFMLIQLQLCHFCIFLNSLMTYDKLRVSDSIAIAQ